MPCTQIPSQNPSPTYKPFKDTVISNHMCQFVDQGIICSIMCIEADEDFYLIKVVSQKGGPAVVSRWTSGFGGAEKNNGLLRLRRRERF